MTETDWNEEFGKELLITLTNEERRYFALAPIHPAWDTNSFYSKTNLWYTKTIVFFDGDTIVKVISETKKDSKSGGIETYTEYDTQLQTSDRSMLIPLTARGKAKPLTASNINAVRPFGCSLTIQFLFGKDTEMWLVNSRANRVFPIGEQDTIAAIRSEDDFHSFAKNYISTCRSDYFDKLEEFKSAQKVTVKYKPGDIFRMEYDRTRYCYGIITGDVKKIKAMPELPEKHSLRKLMMVPIMVRFYQLITENPNMTAENLSGVPLGRVEICGDNDIIWGTHKIVDHKMLEPEDIEFNFVCTKVLFSEPHNTLFTQDMLIRDGLIPKREYTLYIEWGFAQTNLRFDQLSDRLKAMMEDYSSPHGGVAMSIGAYDAVVGEKQRGYYSYRKNLLNPENREILNEIFSCLHLSSDTTFDQFAEKFSGITLREIADRMNK